MRHFISQEKNIILTYLDILKPNFIKNNIAILN